MKSFSSVVPVESQTMDMERQHAYLDSPKSLWFGVKATRGMKCCVLVGSTLSVLWFCLNLVFTSRAETDSECVNYAGRLRFLSQQLGLSLLAAHSLPNTTMADSLNSFEQLDGISSALLGKSSSDTVPQIVDEDAQKLLADWRLKLHLFHDQYKSLGTEPSTAEDLMEIIHFVQALTDAANEIVNEVSKDAAGRVRHLAALNIFRVVTASVWGLVMTWRLRRPYLELYEREQSAARIVEEQKVVIEEQSVEISEYRNGQLHDLPDMPPEGAHLNKRCSRPQLRSPKLPRLINHPRVSNESDYADGERRDAEAQPPVEPDMDEDSASFSTVGHEVDIESQRCSEDDSIYALSSVSQRSNPNCVERFNGSWRVLPVQTWLRELTIHNGMVMDGVGNHFRLKTQGGTTYLEGGTLSIGDDILSRRGKSGLTCHWERVHER